MFYFSSSHNPRKLQVTTPVVKNYPNRHTGSRRRSSSIEPGQSAGGRRSEAERHVATAIAAAVVQHPGRVHGRGGGNVDAYMDMDVTNVGNGGVDGDCAHVVVETRALQEKTPDERTHRPRTRTRSETHGLHRLRRDGFVGTPPFTRY